MIHCSESTTLDDFKTGLLIQGRPDEEVSSDRSHGVGFESAKVGSTYLIISWRTLIFSVSRHYGA